MKQNADHIHTQARKYVQILWPEKLIAIIPDTILSTTRYIQNILPLCPLLSFFLVQAAFTEYLIKSTVAIFFAFFNEEFLDLTNSTSVTTLRTTTDYAGLGLRQRGTS
jgi:hypothetical protein